ncbi:cytochrome P450 705A5-like, partial [Trifolium medium]|nr:cytochrome P450 705A5-like [Trifolium medium]
MEFNFVPFGAGRRGCPGTALAYNLMNTAVAAMVQCFDWKI